MTSAELAVGSTLFIDNSFWSTSATVVDARPKAVQLKTENGVAWFPRSALVKLAPVKIGSYQRERDADEFGLARWFRGDRYQQRALGELE